MVKRYSTTSLVHSNIDNIYVANTKSGVAPIVLPVSAVICLLIITLAAMSSPYNLALAMDNCLAVKSFFVFTK